MVHKSSIDNGLCQFYFYSQNWHIGTPSALYMYVVLIVD